MKLDTNLPLAGVRYNGVEMELRGDNYFWDKYELLLPDGYTAVEWIRSSGTQYIDTGFQPNQDTRVVMDLVFPLPTGNAVAFGCFNNTTSIGYALFANSGGYRKDYNSDWTTAQSTSITTRFIADKNKHILTLDGNSYSSTYAAFSVGLNMFLFARNTGTADCHSSITVYGCQVYNNGTLVRDFVPCVNASGVAGMYDIVNGVFYTNKGTGTFAVGESRASLNKGEFIEIVDAPSINAYPNGGIKDGYYYEVTGEEISITENGVHDVRPYAIANVDVAPVLLWTNASPTSAFVEQTVELPTGYSAYLVEYKFSEGEGFYGIAYLPFGATASAAGCNVYGGTPFSVGRRINECADGRINFGVGCLWYSTSGIQQYNGYGIPTCIWGVKFTL